MDDLKALRGETNAPDPFGQAIADASGFGDLRTAGEFAHRRLPSATPASAPAGPIEGDTVPFVERSLLRLVGGLLLTLLVGAVAAKAAWLLPLLQRRDTLAWAALSLGWWLLLQPSPLGLLLLTGTLVHAWKSSRRAPAPVSAAAAG